jgi:Fic family protein
MSELEVNIHQLDAAYKPFPTFEEWRSREDVDFTRWDHETALLSERANSSSDLLDRARLVATRAAAIDTGAIENLYEVDRGFTYSVAFETTGWELEVSARGEQVRPLFEAQLQAYEYVLTLATGAEPISEAAIRELHVQICSAQATYRVETPIGPRDQPLPKGVYKALPNHVRTRSGVDHSYAPVDVTPNEMHRLVLETRSEGFLAAHPITQATYVHYCLVVVHPFADGNGRVARALASAFTYKAISIPIVILTDQKASYLDALEKADLGDFSAFTRFMLARSLDTSELVLDGLRTQSLEAPDTLISEIGNLYERPLLLRKQVDKLGAALLELIKIALSNSARRLNTAGRVQLRVDQTTFSTEPKIEGYRSFEHTNIVVETKASSSEPAAASIIRYLVAWLPKRAVGESEIYVADHNGGTVFTARIDQLDPATSAVLQLRAELFADRHWAKVLAALKPLAEEALRNKT